MVRGWELPFSEYRLCTKLSVVTPHRVSYVSPKIILQQAEKCPPKIHVDLEPLNLTSSGKSLCRYISYIKIRIYWIRVDPKSRDWWPYQKRGGHTDTWIAESHMKGRQRHTPVTTDQGCLESPGARRGKEASFRACRWNVALPIS